MKFMTSQNVWIAISIGVFFVGIGVSYAIFASTYDPVTMKFQNQQLFDQMMSSNPKMSAHWMDSMQGSQMNQRWEDPAFRNNMINEMLQHQQFMNEMMDNPQFQNQWMGQGMMNSGTMGQGMMGGLNMMNNATMGQHISMHNQIMAGINDPQLKQQVIDEMNRHHQTMLDMLEHAIDDPQLREQLRQKIQQHMNFN